jgi:hypothetical protein
MQPRSDAGGFSLPAAEAVLGGSGMEAAEVFQLRGDDAGNLFVLVETTSYRPREGIGANEEQCLGRTGDAGNRCRRESEYYGGFSTGLELCASELLWTWLPRVSSWRKSLTWLEVQLLWERRIEDLRRSRR